MTISARKGITWHIQNSSNVSTANVSIHAASLFGISEFDGHGGHSYENVYLGRRQGHDPLDMTDLCGPKVLKDLCYAFLK